jgi:uncharacterized protein (DUF58 family)
MPITWVSWPLRDEKRPKTTLLVGLIVLTVLIAAWWAVFWGGLALVLLLVLLGPYFLPCRFEVSERGVKKFFPMFNRDRPWSAYKRFVPQRDGVFLGTFPAPSRLDSYRGDFLRFSRTTDRDGVMALVRKNVRS